jgi:hypothetical protein
MDSSKQAQRAVIQIFVDDIHCHLPEKSQSSTAGNYGAPTSVPLSLGHALYLDNEGLPKCGHFGCLNSVKMYAQIDILYWVHDDCLVCD